MHAPGTPGHSRIMALDVGSKRIGVAVSDPLGITAQGVDTIQRQNKRRDLEALGRVLAKYEVREIVVGLPLRLSGAEGTQSEKMRRFADDLHVHPGPADFWNSISPGQAHGRNWLPATYYCTHALAPLMF